MMNIKNVSAKFLFPCCSSYSGFYLFIRRTDFLSMNMIKAKGTYMHLHIPVNAFKNQKRISASERTLIPRKTPEKME